jgi:hypothetical protein
MWLLLIVTMAHQRANGIDHYVTRQAAQFSDEQSCQISAGEMRERLRQSRDASLHVIYCTRG